MKVAARNCSIWSRNLPPNTVPSTEKLLSKYLVNKLTN